MANSQEQLEKLEQKQAQIKAKIKQVKAREREKERKARTRRLIQVGGAVESALGYPINEEDLPNLIAFLKGQEQRGMFVSKALNKIQKEENH